MRWLLRSCLKEASADFIDVSSGQTTRDAKPVYGRMYQTPFADRIRNEVGIRTIAVERSPTAIRPTASSRPGGLTCAGRAPASGRPGVDAA